jgi:hypothetical protein
MDRKEAAVVPFFDTSDLNSCAEVTLPQRNERTSRPILSVFMFAVTIRII